MDPFLLLKFCGTLQNLTLRLEEDSPNRISESRRHFLLKHIKNLVEIERLHIADIVYITDATFDQLLDDCPAKLKTLATDSFYMSTWDKTLENVKPQTTLESVRIEEHADMTVASLHYFAHKLTKLKELYVRDAFDYPPEEEEKEWWTYFMKIGERLDQLSFRTRFSNTDLQYQIEKIAELGVRMKQGNVTKALYMNFEEGNTLGGGLFNMQMYDDTSFDSIPHFNFIVLHSCKNTDAIRWLKQYAPDRAIISGIMNMRDYYSLDFSELDIQTFFADISKDKSYSLLSNVLDTFGKNKPGSLALFEAVFCGISLAPFKQTLDISDLQFSDSIISEELLQEISSKMQQLDTLILHRCSISEGRSGQKGIVS